MPTFTPTTLAIGEETTSDPYSEDGGGTGGTSAYIGEEIEYQQPSYSTSVPMSTMATGEEEPQPSTMATGEEGGLTYSVLVDNPFGAF
jgi:hypothetical protein